jgi:hypothetical protein
MTLVIPTIHLNGTPKDSLIDALCVAVNSLHQAGKDLAATAPNGRDYYPQGNGAINTAIDQHAARMQKLSDVIRELEVIAESIPF